MLLLTWHGTLVCLPGDGSGILHLPLPLSPAAPAPTEFDTAELPPEGRKLTHPALGPITLAPALSGLGVSVARYGRYLCAEGHTEAMLFDRKEAAEWETYLPIAAADLALLQHILAHRWIIKETREIIPKRSVAMLDGFRLAIGRMRLDLSRGLPTPAEPPPEANAPEEQPDELIVAHAGEQTAIVAAHPRRSLLLQTKEWPTRARRTAELLAAAAHRGLTGREPGQDIFEQDAAFLEAAGGAEALEDLLERLAQRGHLASPSPGPDTGSPASRVPAAEYLAPRDLRLTPSAPVRVWALGSCFLSEALGAAAAHGDALHIDFALATHVNQLPEPPADIGSYDCMLVQISLRSVVSDTALTEFDPGDAQGLQTAFGKSCRKLQNHVKRLLAWNVAHGTRCFVLNFMQPQFNLMGRFSRRFDLRNPEHYVYKLNQELERLVAGYGKAHILDVDRISASLGRRHVQDDLYTAFNHNARTAAGLRLPNRLEAPGPLSDYYDFSPGEAFRGALLAELDAMLRTVAQQDSVKMVVVDLDDTLWQGVSGDEADIGPHMVEGWPIGFVEALHALRRRGVLLAVASKNDETRIRAIWPEIFGMRLLFEDFAILRIDWRPKHENMAEILQTVGLLSRNVVFIDDNPAERAQMQAAFPDMRVLGANPFHLRRALLLAPETQTVLITAESATRTAMVQAQVKREGERTQSAPEDFARQQNVRVSLSRITAQSQPGFPRALELINKTNQFNTTGRRWPEEACQTFFAEGGQFAIYRVRDRYTNYGLVGVVILRGHEIVQWVMSCRVLGLGVERAVMHALVAALRAEGAGDIHAALGRTSVNQPCQSLFADAGFIEQGAHWVLPPASAPEAPAFVKLEEQQLAA